jgi:hypothetical protein
MALTKVYESNIELTKITLVTSAAGGTFRVYWEGRGSVYFTPSAASSGTNSATVVLAAGQTLTMRVLDSWASDPLKNVAVYATNSPDPTEMSAIGGDTFTLLKNWDFGTTGNITNTADLAQEFTFHDTFNTVTNGTNYGAMMTRPVEAPNFGVWNYADIGLNTYNAAQIPAQPADAEVVDNGRYRSFTATTMLAQVKPLNTGSTVVGPASTHNAGNGSMMAKHFFANGGAQLGLDIVWETRVRIVSAPNGYWFALWTAGPDWDGGPEMDVVEAFSGNSPSINGDLWHSTSVNGTNAYPYLSGAWDTYLNPRWGTGFALPNGTQTLRNWHTFTWVYKADNTYVTYVDGRLMQSGAMNWKVPSSGLPTEMHFLYDFSFGHTGISPNNAAVISNINSTPLTYEIDYSRIYTRNPGAPIP